MAGSALVLHCGGQAATRAQVEAVPVPVHTATYKPVRYSDAIDALHNAARVLLRREIVSESYGLNHAGDQLFALITLAGDSDEHGLSIGLRQSYNKTLALGVAVGTRVFVCDNLAFKGSAFRFVRKNTPNVWTDFCGLLTGQVRAADEHHRALSAEFTVLKSLPCSVDRGYELLGLALGKGVLTTTQATVAFADWATPRHEAFAARNMWGWYNACTEALKKGPAGTVIDRHVALHDFVGQLPANV